jgi:hypothetical protein
VAGLLVVATVGGFAAAAARPGASSSDAAPEHQKAEAAQRAAVVTAVDRAIARLEARRAEARGTLRSAGDPREQVEAATALARSYRSARRALPPAAALRTAAPAPELATRLVVVERAYRALATSAEAGDPDAFRRATRLVLARERRLDTTLRQLARQA